MIEQLLQEMRVVALPTRTNFRGVTSREVALFKGPYGWGEFSPFLEYDARESLPWLQSAIEAATVKPHKHHRDLIEVNATIPAINDPHQIEKLLASYPGCRVVKVKVGTNLKEDLARLKVIRDLSPSIALRLDVNGLWGVEQALADTYEIYENFGNIEYIEQPCATLGELREFKTRSPLEVKVTGDEVIRKAVDPFSIDLDGAVDYLMLKVAPLGGIARSLEIAKHHGLPVIVSSALESAVGISHGLALAASLPTLDFACGLATGQLLAHDLGEHAIVDGFINVATINPDPELISQYEVTPDRLKWWQDRVMQTWSQIA